MRVWDETLHPRDWRGRFITKGVHVQVTGGLVGTVRGLRPGRLEGDPADALVELPDGRVGTIPTDRLTVADPPNGYAWLGDGSMGGIGDIVVTDDGREVEIVDINADGSISIAEESDIGNEEMVDPSDLTRGRQMATDDDDTPVRIAESNVPEPPSDDDDLEPIIDEGPTDRFGNPVAVGNLVEIEDGSNGEVTGITPSGLIEIMTDDGESISRAYDEITVVGDKAPDDDEELVPAEDDIPNSDVAPGDQMYLDMSDNATRIADTQNTDQAHERAAMMAESARDVLLDSGMAEDHPLIKDLDARIEHHKNPGLADEEGSSDEPALTDQQASLYRMAHKAADIADADEDSDGHELAAMFLDRLDNLLKDAGLPETDSRRAEARERARIQRSLIDTVEGDDDLPAPTGPTATANDIDGNPIEVGSRVVYDVDPETGGEVVEIHPGGSLTYVNSDGRRRLTNSEMMRVVDPDEAPDESFIPEMDEFSSVDFDDWGDRAEDIASSPGPKLHMIRDALVSNNRKGLKDAIHAAYNGPDGLGKIGATVQFHRVGKNDQMVTFSGNIYDKGNKQIGTITRSFKFDNPDDPNQVTEVHNNYLTLDPSVQGQGIAQAIYRNQENWLIRDGVEKITIEANIDVGGYAWARAGFDYDGEFEASGHVNRMLTKAVQMYGEDDPITKQLQAIADEFNNNDVVEDYPSPFELSRLGYEPGMTMWPGKELMLGTHWNAVKYLTPPANTGVAA